jgi:hypothetical protein
MARVFYDGIVSASDFITPPQTPHGGISDDSPPDKPGAGSARVCPKIVGNAIGSVKTQQGSGTNDGTYVHKSQVNSVYDMANFGGGGNSSGLHWADVSFISKSLIYITLTHAD